MSEQGIPKDVIDELKLKEPKGGLTESCKIVMDSRHQASIKIPASIRNELNLKDKIKDEKSINAKMTLGKDKTIMVSIDDA